MTLTSQQIAFFETFGFLKLPGLLREDMEWITEEFTKVYSMFHLTKPDGSKIRGIVPFIDQREKLSALIDDPRIHGLCTQLLGSDFNYMGSDGNYYSGNTGWHPDGDSKERRHMKIALYLDRLDGTNGALRVIPGSHRLGDKFAQDIKDKISNSEDNWGVHGSEVPAQILDVIPGDLVVFNHNTYHSSWGGADGRRMFTLNLSQRFDDIDKLRAYSVQHAANRRHNYYGKAMVETAGLQRMKHLEQVMSQDFDLYERTSHMMEISKI